MVSECENYTKGGENYQLTSLWIDTFIQDVVTGIGIIGNILICVILMQKNVRNTFNQLRVALALFDIIMLITMFTTNVLFRSLKDILQAVYPVFLWPLKSFAMTISVFMTVAIAWERHGAINDPYTYKTYQEYRAMKYVSSLTVASVILNMGKFFELQPNQCIERPGFSGVFKLASIFKNRIYALYYNLIILRILIAGIVPMTLLIYLYTKIVFKIREHNKNMASQNITMKNKMVKEHRMAITFAGVVITSLVCTIPGWLIVVQVLINGGDAKDLDYYETVFIVRDILFTLNSAINIFIYTCLDKMFRRELKKFLGCLFWNPIKCRKELTSSSSNNENKPLASNSNVETTRESSMLSMSEAVNKLH